MRHLMNMVRQQAAQVNDEIAKTRFGTVESYDPDAYSVRVLILPEGNLSNWIPLGAVWVGNGWGMFAPPGIGDRVELEFQEGDINAPVSNLRLFTDDARPLPVPSGEFWLVHQTGTKIQLLNNGNLEISTPGNINYTAAQHTFTGPVQMTDTLNVVKTISGEGGITVTGDNGSGNASTVTGNIDFQGQVSANGKRIDDSHKHSNGNGGQDTGTPL